MEAIRNFLKEYSNDGNSTTLSDENIHPKIVGNFCLDRKDVYYEVIDWILHHLESRKCPYQLAVAIAKKIAQEMDNGISEFSQESEKLDKEKLLNSVTLYNEMIKKLPSVCSTFLEQNNEQEVCSSSYSSPYATSAYAIKNKRRKMEDRHVVHHDLNLLLDLKDLPTHSYYAVFDGHSGVDAASYASAHLHVNIVQHPAFLTDPSTAITEAFRTTNENFLKKCSEENLKSGSTAITALIKENTLYLSWLGDAQAVIVKKGHPTLVTNPHKPERPEERKRIESLGGTVTNMGVWRVNGILAVTRAIGDPDHRPFISGEPETITLELDGTEDFLILASDGLWDLMTPENVASTLYYNLKQSALDEPLDAVAAKLVHQSKLLGSEDNITVIVVFLRDIKIVKDFASEFLNQSVQLNFLEVNGEGEEPGNVSCSKPTVLELNSASAKKLKNAANVLSSAGFNYFEQQSLNNSDLENVFSPPRSLASCLAPEATALSELPTPPIDEVVALQKFEKLCPDELHQGLSSLSSAEEKKETIPETVMSISDLNIQEPEVVIDHSSKKDSVVEYPANEITPNEAKDIASSVVSDTIETAVRHLSSSELYESASQSSTLNPYAKPFVPGEAQLQCGTENVDSDIPKSDAINTNQITDVAFRDVKNTFSTEDSFEDNNAESNTLNIVDSPAVESEVNGSTMSEVVSKLSRLVVDSSSEQAESESSLLNDNETEEAPIPCEKLTSSANDEPNILNLQETEEKKSNLVPSISLESLQIAVSSQNLISEMIQISNNLNTVCLNISSTEMCLVKDDPTMYDQGLLNYVQTPEELDLAKASLELPESVAKPVNKPLVDSVADMIDSVSTLCDVVSNQELLSTAKVVENLESVQVEEKASLLDLVNNTSVLDSVPFISLEEELISIATAQPSDVPDEVPAEAVAVDLKTLPDGIPEAEGVTEDVDSDSEKDGGWSYMKIAGEKPKSETTVKGETSSDKPKLETKAVADSKPKGKTATAVDKSRKPVEKQSSESKEKVRPTKTVSSPMTRLAATKSATRVKKEPTSSSSSKTLSSAITNKNPTAVSASKTVAASKPTRPTTLQNTNSASKSASIPDRKPTLTKTSSTVSANGNVRSKTASAPNITKAPVRVTSASALSSKAQPLNQNNKSNTASGLRTTAPSRPATSTVPSRPLTKPSTLSKSFAVPNLKPKLPSTTLRKPEPKKPDVKETKDIVNKQISAQRNITVGTVTRNDKAKTSTTIRNALTLSNKPVSSKIQSAPVKSDVGKKEVPKPAPSRIVSKMGTAKVSQNASKTKPKEVKNTSVQGKAQATKIEVAAETKQTPVETPVCEEKFLLEANDKEVMVKENDETPVNCNQKLCLENGVDKPEPMEDIATPELNLI